MNLLTSTEPILWRFAAVLAVATAALLYFRPMDRLAPPPDLTVDLRPVQTGSHLRVEWDQDSEAIRKAEGGTIEVTDGQVWRYPLSRPALLSGAFDHDLKTDDARVTLTVIRGGEPFGQGILRTVARTIPAAEQSGSSTGASQTGRRFRTRRR